MFGIFNSSKKSKDSRPSANKFKPCTKRSLLLGSYPREIAEEPGTKLPLFFISYKAREHGGDLSQVSQPQGLQLREVLHSTLRAVSQRYLAM